LIARGPDKVRAVVGKGRRLEPRFKCITLKIDDLDLNARVGVGELRGEVGSLRRSTG
jgi:hypothetical protein